jgi:hypothetical protein
MPVYVPWIRLEFGALGVADHSQSEHYAGGISLEEIAEQLAEIDRLNAYRWEV